MDAHAAELLERMRAAWEPVRSAARGASDAYLDGQTPAGWTYKEMLAHIAAWQDLTARRLAIYRATGQTEPPGGPDALRVFEHLGFSADDRDALMNEWAFDRFNAAVVNAARGRSRDDVLRALDDSFARLSGEVAQLSDDQVAAHVEDGHPFVEAVLDGNTFGHYEEHREELDALRQLHAARR